ncbi:Protein of unknown function [bacterium A37T11]|nr:Protein of unknown function [bacterium A37T11]
MNEAEYRDMLMERFINGHKEYNPEYIYKYLDFNGGYLSLKNLNIQFSHPYTFSDLTECRKFRIKFKNKGKRIKDSLLDESLNRFNTPISVNIENIRNKSYREIELFTEHNWEKITLEKAGIACFTTLANSTFHWNNYADKHNGICVKYNFMKLLTHFENSSFFYYWNNQSLIHGPIIYLDEIIPISYGDDFKLLMLQNWIYVKKITYAEEKEYRIYSQNCDLNKQIARIGIDRACIENVYFGSNVSSDNIARINDLGF